MEKFFVRFTIIATSIFLIIAYLVDNFAGIDILDGNHVILFEICVVIYTYSEGKYHCKYIKHTALAILLSDTLTRLDYLFDFLSVSAHNLIPIGILFVGIATSTIQAIVHFIKVQKLKRQINK